MRRSATLVLSFVLAAAVSAQAGGGRLLQVGPERALKSVSVAAQQARHGDTVEIDAGTYLDDFAVFHQDNLVIRGVGGMAHLKATRPSPNGKGTWIINGDNTRVENIEFSGARVRDTNGAAIRHQGGDLYLYNTFFHNNEFSVLSGRNLYAHIHVSNSRFWHQRRETRFSHGIYIGTAGRLTLIGNHFKGTDQGHQVKSRALENYILYNRIEDGTNGNSSRLIDLPNCGFSVVMGNEMQQAVTSSNLNVIGYGMEGCADRSERQKTLFVVNNTLVNDAYTGTFVDNAADGAALVVNNLYIGSVSLLSGPGKAHHNVHERLTPWGSRGWDIPEGSEAIDGAASMNDVSLVPKEEFRPPAGTRPRPVVGPLDVGARERNGN